MSKCTKRSVLCPTLETPLQAAKDVSLYKLKVTITFSVMNAIVFELICAEMKLNEANKSYTLLTDIVMQ